MGSSELEMAKIDFIDFGSSLGGSMALAKKLGGKRGLGIDRDPKKVDAARRRGNNVLCLDATTISLTSKSVKFCMISHFLEHLTNQKDAEKVIRKAIETATDFVFIQGPYFDADHKLKDLGLKLYWSDWHGHKTRITGTFLRNLFDSIGCSYTLLGYIHIDSSLNSCVLPLSAPTDSFEYDEKKHGSKPTIAFPFAVFKEVVGIVWLSNSVDKQRILKAKSGAVVLAEK